MRPHHREVLFAPIHTTLVFLTNLDDLSTQTTRPTALLLLRFQETATKSANFLRLVKLDDIGRFDVVVRAIILAGLRHSLLKKVIHTGQSSVKGGDFWPYAITQLSN